MAKILVVDDDPDILEFVEAILRARGHDVTSFSTGVAALEFLLGTTVDLVLSDIRMPGVAGLEMLAKARELDASIPFVLITGFGSVDEAVEALRAGADDYLEKPMAPDLLVARIERTLEAVRLRRRVESFERARALDTIVAVSPQMVAILGRLPVVATSDAPVLLTGETGTGKEVLARALHESSARRSAAFVAVNCGAIPENLIESEFFGHRKGSFTGADRNKAGLLAEADGGTLFLDEIGDLPLLLQVKILRSLEEKEFRAVGATKSTPVDVRVISATNQDLEAAIAGGAFRQDLYYRLNAIHLRIPPLRERPDDVVALAERFLRDLARERNREGWRLTPAALDRLKAHAWPGNVRELRNRIFEAVLFTTRDEIGPEQLFLDHRTSRPGADIDSWSGGEESPMVDFKSSKTAFERRYFLRLLERHAGNVTEVAAESGLSTRAIYKILTRQQLDPETFRHRKG